jgi:hypothetical protein
MKTKKHRIARIKLQNTKTHTLKKSDCRLADVDKYGLSKPTLSTDLDNQFECLLAGHRNCLMYMYNSIPQLSQSTKNKLIKHKTKIYKNMIYIYPRYKKHAILCNYLQERKKTPIVMNSLDAKGMTEFSKFSYVQGVLLGYRQSEIRGFYLRGIALLNIGGDFTKVFAENKEMEKLEEKIIEELKKMNIPEFNKKYKIMKSICDKWLKMNLGKDSIFNDLFEKADIDNDIKLLEFSK